MVERERVQQVREERTPRRREDKEDTAPPVTKSAVVEKGKRIKDDIDALAEEIDGVLEDNTEGRDAMNQLIDEIDAALEVNAEEFVQNYVQRGGE